MKKQLLLILLLVLQSFVVFIPSPSSDWIIDGDTVYIDDENAYLSATPHTIIQDTWVTFKLRSKGYEGDIDACWLFNTTNCKPTKPVYYKIGDGDWQILNKEFTVETIAFENMTKAYLLKNVNIQKDVNYSLKCFVDIKFNTQGKYWWGVKPSALGWANGYYIDPWWNSSWLYKKKITIDHAKVAGDLTNFPVLIQNTSSDFIAHARSDGFDFRFVDSAETTEYYWELEDYNSTTGTLTAWVNITSLADDTNTVLYCYYGNSGANTNPSNNSTWDSDFVSVWHLNETSGDINDSTSNNKDGVREGNPTYQQTGQIGYSIYLDGTGDYFDIPNDYGIFTTENFTIEAWVKFTETVTNDHIVSLKGEASTALQLSDTPGVKQTYYVDGAWKGVEMKPNPDTTDWHYYAATYDNDVQMLGYYDGTNTATDSGGNISSSSGDSCIGYSGTGDAMNGTIDEIRISSITRSGNWINTTYNTTSSPSTFATFGLETVNTSIITNATTGIELTNATARGYFEGAGWVGNYNYGFWIGRTTPVTEGNADQNVTGASTITEPNNFSYNVSSLSKGTHYYVVAWIRNSTELSLSNNENNFWTKCDPPTGFTATASGCNVNLAWTKGTGAVRTTVVRKVDSYPTSQTDGTVVYNNTASSYSDTTGSGSHQYYRTWSWAGDKHSDANASANVVVPPCPPTSVSGSIVANGSLNISWTKGTGADTTLVLRKIDSTPSSVTDGTILYNNTGVYTFTSDFTENYYYRLWSYANETYSTSVALNYGALVVSCYDEETNGSLYFDVFVSNQSGSQTYESLNNTNPLTINVADNLPIDDKVSIHVSAASNYSDKTETFTGYSFVENLTVTYVILLQPPESKALTNVTCRNATASTNSYPAFTLADDVITILADAADEFSQITVNYTHYEYESRTYYRDLTTNHIFVLNAYLPSTADKILCRITVIDEISQAVDDAYVQIRRNINGSWVTIASRYTDGNGQVDVFLVDGVLYKFVISKTDYVTEYADWTPSTDAPTHTFQLEAEELEPDEDLYFDDYITFNGHVDLTTDTLYVNYTDALNETTNTAIYIYEYNYSTYTSTLIYSDTRSNDYDFQISTTINSSNAHTVVLYVNHTNFDFVTRTIFFEGNITTTTTPARGESLLTLNYKSNPFGWTNTITWFILLIIYFNYGQRDAGIGLIFSGVFLLFINSYVGFTDVATTAAGGGIPILHIVVGIIAVIRAERKQVIT